MPLLIAGLGKPEWDAFVCAVARALALPWFWVDVGDTSDASRPQSSAVFTTLAFGTASHAAVANPIGMAHLGPLQAPSDVQRADDFAAWLRVDAAQSACDPCVPNVRFNASFVRWLLWCSDLARVPTAILNNSQVLRVTPPQSL